MSLRLAIFDLDGTLKQARDPYVFLHKELGTWQAAQAFTGKGLGGELDYEEWLRLDALLWKGIARVTMEAALQKNPYLPGAQETVRVLRDAGVCVAVVSTGLLLQAEQAQTDLGLDRIIANEILFEHGRATGKARCHVSEGAKGPIVAQLQAEFGVEPGECLVVGDGTSDADMFAHAHLGVAVNPSSEQVRLAADLVLETPDLRPLIPQLEEIAPGWLA